MKYAYYIVLKSAFDFIFSILMFILILPLFLLISLFIKLDSEGPILFKQKRLGKLGKEFYIFKFRTMCNNAENIGDGLTVKSSKDFRITRVGYFLRKTSLDEIPQLLNIIKGDMSFIGPRPPVVYFPYDGYLNYPTWAKKRFRIKPGVTGLAQSTVRNSVSWDERMKIDIVYIENISLLYDLKILFLTFFSLLSSRNVYDEGRIKRRNEK